MGSKVHSNPTQLFWNSTIVCSLNSCPVGYFLPALITCSSSLSLCTPVPFCPGLQVFVSESLARGVCCQQRCAAPEGLDLASQGIRKTQHPDEASDMKDSRDQHGFSLFLLDFPAVLSTSRGWCGAFLITSQLIASIYFSLQVSVPCLVPLPGATCLSGGIWAGSSGTGLQKVGDWAGPRAADPK